jgi:hypothetical protein
MDVILAPYVPSDEDVVHRMLEVAGVGPGDVVCDLGCGDGRILFAAVTAFGAEKAVGYELREDLYRGVVAAIHQRHLADRVTVFHEDLLRADLSAATVITLYLTTAANTQLMPKLVREAKPGTRVVSHFFRMAGWPTMRRDDVRGHTIYLYTVPDTREPRVPPRGDGAASSGPHGTPWRPSLSTLIVLGGVGVG